MMLSLLVTLALPLFPPSVEVFEKKNLVAWCIVPFDAKKRGPEERAAMLVKLGFTKFAYDWRAEHLKTFDEEVQVLKKQKIELTAIWFPATLNEDAKTLLAVVKKYNLKPQLWVMLTDPAPKGDDTAKVKAAVATLKPVVDEAEKLGCKVGLYNHGSWFGEPENQIKIIQAMKSKHVGIVYNLHHGHDHLAKFPELLEKMMPHLLCLNLNGMNEGGDKKGQKILPVGQGEKDLLWMNAIIQKGYTGPLGIIGHTQDDAEVKLRKDLEGLKALVQKVTK